MLICTNLATGEVSVMTNSGLYPLTNKVYLNNDHYRFFLRLDNRKKYYFLNEITDHDYEIIWIANLLDSEKTDLINQVRQWTEKNLQKGSYIRGFSISYQQYVIFSNRLDAAYFRLVNDI